MSIKYFFLRIRLIPVGIVIFFAVVNISSQQRPSYEADLRRGVKTDSTFVQQLEGNVILRQNDIIINCNTANYYPNTNISILTGNVKLTQESLTLYSDRLVYDGNTKVSDSPGQVKIVDGATVLTADNGIYFGDPKVAIFRDEVSIEDDSVKIDSDYIRYEKISGNSFGYGDVEIQGKFSNTQLYTDSVEYYPDEFYTLAVGNPILFQIDTVGVNPDYISLNTESNSPAAPDYPKYLFDTLTVSADTMQAYRTPYDEHFFFKDSVVVTKSRLTLNCDRGIYYKDRDYFSFTGTPVIWYDSTQLYGDSIIMNVTVDNQLKDLQAYENSLMVSEADSIFTSRKNQLSSDYLELNFESGDINQAIGYGKSKSLYFFIDEGQPDGAVLISSDKSDFEFENNEIIKIHYTSDPPKNDGTQFPEKAVSKDPNSINLPGFKWSPNKPVQKVPIPRKMR